MSTSTAVRLSTTAWLMLVTYPSSAIRITASKKYWIPGSHLLVDEQLILFRDEVATPCK